MAEKVREIGPYSRPNALAKLDRRTKAARHFAAVVKQLTEHVGGNPSPVQAALIQRAAWLTVRVALFDKQFALRGDMTERETNTYLAWSNSLARILAGLGNKRHASKQTPTSLGDYLSKKSRRRSSEAHEPAA